MSWIKSQPKTVLHRHLEGAVPHRIIWNYYKRGLTSGYSWKTEAEMKAQVTLVRPMKDLQEVLDAFIHQDKCFCSMEAVTEITKEAIIDAFNEGIVNMEYRFSPHYMARIALDLLPSNAGISESAVSAADGLQNLNWDQMMEAIEKGAEQAKQVTKGKTKVGWIVIVSRNYGPEVGLKTAEFAKAFRNRIHGFDFAAAENLFPAEVWVPTVQKVKELGLPLTVHTGEGSSTKNIEEVLRLYAPQRLGHATKLIEDPHLMNVVRDRKILVEACPTSNIITNSVASYPSHPLVSYLRHGIPVSINDDDGSAFDVDICDEWYFVMKEMKLTKEDMGEMEQHARKHTFIN